MSVAGLLLDPSIPDVRVGFGIARAEYAAAGVNRSTAELHAAVYEVIDEARCHPEVYLHDRSGALSARDSVEFAERAAAADLAVRLSMSEAAIRSMAHDASTMRRRLPRLWARFLEGNVSPANARCAADLARSLPDNAQQLAAFDAAVSEPAASLAPARFRARARVLRERIHHVALAERARAAAESRGVWIENDLDGMAWLSMRLPADVAHRAYAGIDSAARSLDVADESRTLAQLRADVAGDALLGTPSGRHAPVAVAVTVPVMTLLGVSEEPATLDGYGPIDPETARRLAAHAPSFTRLLTHPVSGGLLDIDRASYRPPADLKRWVAATHLTCAFPGCGRSASGCDIDHTIDRQFGGTTRAGNLAPLCRHHHRLKHMTGWKVKRSPSGPLRWTSPTGHERDSDPPPF